MRGRSEGGSCDDVGKDEGVMEEANGNRTSKDLLERLGGHGGTRKALNGPNRPDHSSHSNS